MLCELPKGRTAPGENLSMTRSPLCDAAGPGGCCWDGRKPTHLSRSRPTRNRYSRPNMDPDLSYRILRNRLEDAHRRSCQSCRHPDVQRSSTTPYHGGSSQHGHVMSCTTTTYSTLTSMDQTTTQEMRMAGVRIAQLHPSGPANEDDSPHGFLSPQYSKKQSWHSDSACPSKPPGPLITHHTRTHKAD